MNVNDSSGVGDELAAKVSAVIFDIQVLCSPTSFSSFRFSPIYFLVSVLFHLAPAFSFLFYLPLHFPPSFPRLITIARASLQTIVPPLETIIRQTAYTITHITFFLQQRNPPLSLPDQRISKVAPSDTLFPDHGQRIDDAEIKRIDRKGISRMTKKELAESTESELETTEPELETTRSVSAVSTTTDSTS